MSASNTKILHGLMTDMQIAYYWAFLFDKNGNAQECNAENMATLEAKALRACKNAAMRAIKHKRIPKRMYVYANAFAVNANPMEVVERTYHLYAQDNPEVENAGMDQPA